MSLRLCNYCKEGKELDDLRVAGPDTFICLDCLGKFQLQEDESVCAKCEKPLKECRCQ